MTTIASDLTVGDGHRGRFKEAHNYEHVRSRHDLEWRVRLATLSEPGEYRATPWRKTKSLQVTALVSEFASHSGPSIRATQGERWIP